MTLRAPALMALGCVIVCLSAGLASAEEPERWYLLELSAAKPPCEDAGNARCYGTQPEITEFEIRSGERLEIPERGSLPPSWVRMRDLWVYAPAVDDNGFVLALDRTPSGVRIILRDAGVSFVQSLGLDRWTRLDGNDGRTLWARATRLQFERADSSNS